MPWRCDWSLPLPFSSSLLLPLLSLTLLVGRSVCLSLFLSCTAWSLWPLFSQQKEEPQREQGAKYSAETGRLIPAATQAISRCHSRHSRRQNYPSGRAGGAQTFILQDQELLVRPWEGPSLRKESVVAPAPSSEQSQLGLLQTALKCGFRVSPRDTYA